MKSDQGNLQFLQVQLDWCRITAPFTGRVGLRLVDPGNVVLLSAANQINATTSLAVITQIQPITVVFTLAQDNLAEVRSQMRRGVLLPVFAYDRALATKIGSGRLTAIDNQIDTTTGTVKLRALFDNLDDALFPQSVRKHETSGQDVKRRHADSHTRHPTQWSDCLRIRYPCR